MTYSPTEPQDLPPPVIATTQIRTNFAQFQTIFTDNHSPLNNSNQGKHTGVLFEQQTSDPGVISNYDAMYAKSVTNASSTQPQLFIQIPQFLPNNQPNLPEQITFDTVNKVGPVYQTFIPGGYIMYFGSIGAVPSTITLIPACSKIVSVVVLSNVITPIPLTPVPLSVFATITSANTFDVDSQPVGFLPPSYRFSWVAIGIQ